MQKIERRSFYRVSGPLYKGLIDLVLELPIALKATNMIEIGSYIGESANLFSLFFKEVHCIDPHNMNLFDVARDQFLTNTKGRNIILHPKKAEEVYQEFPDQSVGLVYIDAVHTYEAVKQDIGNYYSKVMDGAYLGGHDYDEGPEEAGVVKAVNEIFGEPDFNFCDGSWLIKKTPGRIKG